MTTPPLVSIGLPVFNGAKHLRQAIDSLLKQDFGDFEIIISDNASTDLTPSLCADYAAREKRIRYYRSDVNRGAVWNFNRVFHLSASKYFMWAAHDDFVHPQYVSKCVATLDANPLAVVCHSYGQPILENGDAIGPPYVDWVNDAHSRRSRWRLILSEWSLHAAIYGLIRSEALRRTRLLQPQLSCDLILMAELSLLGGIIQVPEVLQWKRVPERGDYRSPQDTLALLGSRRKRPHQFHRMRTILSCIAGMRHCGFNRKESMLLTTEAFRTYVHPRFLGRDLLEFAWSALSVFPSARPGVG